MLVASALPFTPSGAANRSIASKRREAAKISAQIESLGVRIAELNEDHLSAQERLGKLTTQSERSTVARDAVVLRLERIRVQLREQALYEFTHPAGGSALDALEGSSDFGDFERRMVIEHQQSGRKADLADQLRADQADLARSSERVETSRRQAAATSALLARQRREADALAVKLDRLAASTKGELATLVREEEQRLAAEEVRAATAALERRRTAAKAALLKARAELLRRSSKPGRSRTADVTTSGPAVGARIKSLEIEAGLAAAIPTSPGAARAVQRALSQLGKPYVWGADGPGSFDCSGLMLYAWAASGRSLPHSSRSQFAGTKRVSVSAIRPGDLVFFGRPIHHVGMYVGNGKMVEASRRGKPVKIGSIFRRDMVGVGRV
jgi:peptidoglycan DL-endopeptidase CwlO